MDDCNLEEKALNKWHDLQHCKSMVPKTYKEWQMMLIRITIYCRWHYLNLRFTIRIEQDK